MRPTPEERRAAIIAIAADVFLKSGYEAASMSEISALVGGSKSTLYGLFPSKEALFIAVMAALASRFGDSLEDILRRGGDLRETLQEFGETYLSFLLSPQIVAFKRVLHGDSGRSNVGKLAYEQGLKTCLTEVSGFFEGKIDKGRLRRADTWKMTQHFLALLEAELTPLCMLGVIDFPGPDRIREAVGDGVDVFLRAYGAVSEKA